MQHMGHVELLAIVAMYGSHKCFIVTMAANCELIPSTSFPILLQPQESAPSLLLL